MIPADDPLSPSLAERMIGHNLASVTDNYTASQYNDLDALADETPGYGIAVCVEIDGAVRLHLAHEVAELSKRCAAG